jgi:ferredoxin-NADP reductase
MMTPELIKEEVGRAAREGWLFFCGPGPMIHAAHRGLRALGVPRHRMLEERFSLF